MKTDLPRVATVNVVGPLTLRVSWRAERVADEINLAGWIATGGDILSVLGDAGTFKNAKVGDYGASVTWDDGKGDLAIDAVHLKRLADEQKPFDSRDVNKWQDRVKLSNNEVADLLDVALSTWNSYKAGAKLPKRLQIVLRAIERDPIVLQAHYRPRIAGRPRKHGAA